MKTDPIVQRLIKGSESDPNMFVGWILAGQIAANKSKMVGVHHAMDSLEKLGLKPPKDLKSLLSSLVDVHSLLQWMREEFSGSWYIYLSEVEEWEKKFISMGQSEFANNLRKFRKELYPHSPKTSMKPS